MPTNILDTPIPAFKGADVYVIGSGPNGKGCYGDIPKKGCVISVNKAVEIPLPQIQVWLFATPGLLREEWFTNLICDLEPVLKKEPFIIARAGALIDTYPDIPYYFLCGPSLWSKEMPKGCIQDCLRGGASACARAVQLAWFNEAKRVILIGADMKGDGYFDGTRNEHKKNTMKPDGLWFELPYFNELIEWCKMRGMGVVSMSKTALDIEVI